jgi:hypothetical protein
MMTTETFSRVRVSSLVQSLFAVVTLVLGCVFAAWWMMYGPLGELLPLVTAVTLALMLVGRWNFGALVALLVLVVLNGIPGPDLEKFAVSGTFRISDVAVVALIAALALRQQPHAAQPGSLLRFARWWGIVFVTWWLLTLVRSVADGVPPLQAALFGRDFLYFAVVLPLLAGAFRHRREIVACLSLLAAAAVLHAIGQLAVSAFGFGSSRVEMLVHTTLINTVGDTERLYAFMADAVTAAVPLGLGLALIPRRRTIRLLGVALALLATTSVLFQFTRATYLGLVLALTIVGALWLNANTSISQALRRTVAICAALVVVAIFVSDSRPLTGSLVWPSGASAVSERWTSTFEDLVDRTGTVGYREQLTDQMLHVLGSNWPVGLGFWHPDARPVPSLPNDSIRNGDVGVLNAIMTMGAVGAALLYVPLLVLFLMMMRTRRWSHPRVRRHHWFFFGASTWMLYVVVSSASLVTLFGVPGLMLTSTIMASGIWLIDQELTQER